MILELGDQLNLEFRLMYHTFVKDISSTNYSFLNMINEMPSEHSSILYS